MSTVSSPAPGADLGVCMLTQDFVPKVAGAEKQLLALLPGLNRRRVRVLVLTRRQPGLAGSVNLAGAAIRRVWARGGRIAASLTFTLACLSILVRQRRRIDVLHAHGIFSPSTTAVIARLLLGKRVVVKPLGGGQFGDLAVLRRVRLGTARLWLLARLVDVFVAVSDEIARELRSCGVPDERIAKIPNGVDCGRFQPATTERRQALREELGLGDRQVALYVGRLEPEKGLDLLLEAWAQVRQLLPRALLLIVGDGGLRSSLERRAGPSVRFVGLADDPLPYYQAADCFVLSSRSEGLPNALLEALAAGLPVVATAVGGIVDVVGPDAGGLLVAPGDPGALAAALGEALSRVDRERMGQAGRARVLADYSLERTADRLLDLYRQLAAPGRLA